MFGAIAAGLGIATGIFGAKKQAQATTAAAGYQYQASAAQIAAEERMFTEQLEFDKEKFEYLKTQAQGPLGQTGSYSYPYVSVTQVKEQPSLILPLAIGAGCFYFFILRRKR